MYQRKHFKNAEWSMRETNEDKHLRFYLHQQQNKRFILKDKHFKKQYLAFFHWKLYKEKKTIDTTNFKFYSLELYLKHLNGLKDFHLSEEGK